MHTGTILGWFTGLGGELAPFMQTSGRVFQGAYRHVESDMLLFPQGSPPDSGMEVPIPLPSRTEETAALRMRNRTCKAFGFSAGMYTGSALRAANPQDASSSTRPSQRSSQYIWTKRTRTMRPGSCLASSCCLLLVQRE